MIQILYTFINKLQKSHTYFSALLTYNGIHRQKQDLKHIFSKMMACQEMNSSETFLVVQWLRLHAFSPGMQGAQVQFLVRELRSHLLHGAAKNKYTYIYIYNFFLYELAFCLHSSLNKHANWHLLNAN